MRLGLPRYPDYKSAPKQWLHDMAIVDQIARHYETMQLAIIVQGAAVTTLGQILGGGGSRHSGADDDE